MSFLNSTCFLDFLFDAPVASGHVKTVIARSVSQKLKDNIGALKLVKRYIADMGAGAVLSEADRDLLSRYCGWGQHAAVFEASHPGHTELRNLLSPAEYAAVEGSVLTSYYTDEWLIDAMYRAVSRLGVQDGCLLDFATGSGRFLHRQPHVLAGMKAFGVELDGLTGSIARLLNPKAKIYVNQPFESVKLPHAGDFSLVIGNPPYGAVTAKDRTFGKLNLHDYFLIRGLAELHNGGLMAVVVSSWVMDSKGDEARQLMANFGDLVAACRLPNAVFKSEGANVVTDILIFQAAAYPTANPLWLDTVELTDDNHQSFRINRLFAEHPELIAGTLKAPANIRMSCCVDAPSGDLSANVTAILDSQTITPVFHRPSHQPAARIGLIVAPAGVDDVGPFEFCLSSQGELLRRVADSIDDNGQNCPTFQGVSFKSQKDAERVLGMLRVKKALAALIDAERENATFNLSCLRADLNATYDQFVKLFGPFHASKNKSVLQEDPWYYRLRALEVNYVAPISAAVAAKEGVAVRPEQWDKGDLFKRRVLTRATLPTYAESLADAVLISASFKGTVDLAYVRQLASFNGDDQALTQALADQSLAFVCPQSGHIQIAAKYLSGYLPHKLALAEAQAQHDPLFALNAASLRAAMPAPVKAIDIYAPINARWLPTAYVCQFVRHLTNNDTLTVNLALIDNDFHLSIGWVPATVSTAEWGTARRKMEDLLSSLLNSRAIEVRDADPKNPSATIANPQETMAAQHKADEIKAAWEAWVLDDADRRNEIETIYNEHFNGFVAPRYDGSQLPLTGSSVELYPVQRNAIARILQEKATLIDHAVGTGKTFTMIGAAAELRRINPSERIVIVAPNHLIAQHATAAQFLFPSLNVFVLDKNMMAPATRRTALARLAMTDFDLCIIPLSVFSLIPAPQNLMVQMMEAEIDYMRECLTDLKNNQVSVRRMLTRIKNKEADLAELVNKRTDDMLDFADLRISTLIIDESQFGKNLCYTSALQNVAGMGQAAGSKRAFDLYIKSQYVLRNGGRYVESTGTPILNSVVEAHRHLRVMANEFTCKAGLTHFDAFSAVFAQPVTDYELAASGRGYKMKTRISTFTNLTELQAIYSSFADVVTAEQLPDVLPKLADGRPAIPPLTGGKVQELLIYPNAHQDRGFAEIVRAYEHTDNKDNNPLKLLNQGRMLSLDARLLYPDAPDYEDNKINSVVRFMLEKYQATSDVKGTQMVFMDRSIPARHRVGESKVWADLFSRAKAGDEEAQERVAGMDEAELSAMLTRTFSLYDELVEKLIAGGIPRNEIAVIHDYRSDARKETLRDAMNAGQIRVLLGSTELAGSGLNINQRLVSLIHFDLPYRPGDLAQRNGRIERQGNLLWAQNPDFTIDVVVPITHRCLDAWQLGLLNTKQRFITLFRQLDNSVRHYTEQSEAIDYAELSAIVADDPRILAHVRGKAKLRKLEAVRNNWFKNRVRLEDQAGSLARRNAKLIASSPAIQQDSLAIAATSSELLIEVDGKQYDEMGVARTNDHIVSYAHTAAAPAVSAKFNSYGYRLRNGQTCDLACYRGATLVFKKSPFNGFNYSDDFAVRGPSGHCYDLHNVKRNSINGVMAAFIALVDSLPMAPQVIANTIANNSKLIAEYRAEAAKPFAEKQELEELLIAMQTLEQELATPGAMPQAA